MEEVKIKVKSHESVDSLDASFNLKKKMIVGGITIVSYG